ncbi:hypothetical protein GQ457_02G032280 [Hibiscus cannabinus]
MSDYMPVEVIVRILKRLPAKSVVRFRSVCKSWDTLISDPSFISTHLQASLSNNTSFLLFLCVKNGKTRFSLHYDQDGFEESKQLHLPPFSSVLGSCNGLICVQLFSFVVDFLLWNPSIQKVRAVQPDYAFRRQTSLSFVNGAVHWLGNHKRNGGGYSHAILGFDLSAEEFFEIDLPENLIDLCHADLTIMKYGESSIAVSTCQAYAELHDLWVMKEYGLVESWTKVLTIHRVVLNTDFPRGNSLFLILFLFATAAGIIAQEIIGHVRKSSLIDFLVFATATGIIAQEITGDVRMTNTSADEAERGITIKSTGISLSTPG